MMSLFRPTHSARANDAERERAALLAIIYRKSRDVGGGEPMPSFDFQWSSLTKPRQKFVREGSLLVREGPEGGSKANFIRYEGIH